MIPKGEAIEGKLNRPLPWLKLSGTSQREVEKGLAPQARLDNLAFPIRAFLVKNHQRNQKFTGLSTDVSDTIGFGDISLWLKPGASHSREWAFLFHRKIAVVYDSQSDIASTGITFPEPQGRPSE